MKLTNNLNLPQPFVDAVTNEYAYKDKQYSVTSLLKGTCQSILERRHHNEIETDVADMVFMIFGSAVHSILENGKETDDQIKENKIVIDIDEYKLSGIFDLYDAKEKKVVDYKTASVWKVQFNDWEDYRKQLLTYAWMLRKIGFECEKGEIVAMLKDHSKTKAKVDSSYPQKPVHKVLFNFTEKDFEEIEKWVYEKFNVIRQQETLPDADLEPCSAEERWSKGDKYAVMKNGRKSALKLCNSQEEADEYISSNNLDSKHYVEFRKGVDSKCTEYCSCCEFCKYYKENYKNE